MDKPWYDIALGIYLIVFFLLEAHLLRRNTALGWTMTSKCLALSALFTYALLVPFIPNLRGNPFMALKVWLALSLTFAILAMLRGGEAEECPPCVPCVVKCDTVAN
jgi:hypothetical protein